jgi:hypothetical protein
MRVLPGEDRPDKPATVPRHNRPPSQTVIEADFSRAQRLDDELQPQNQSAARRRCYGALDVGQCEIYAQQARPAHIDGDKPGESSPAISFGAEIEQATA